MKTTEEADRQRGFAGMPGCPGLGYTPGPWKASQSGGAVLSDWRQRLDDGESVLPFASAVNPICWTHDTDIPLEQRRANARLIAVAPEMMIALWAAEAALQSCYEVTEFPADGQSDCDCALALIREVIRKATLPSDNNQL